MNTPLAQCPDCGNSAHAVGPIPATDVFAGCTLGQAIPGGWLYRCQECQLGFRWPRLGKDELDTLYVQGDDWTWTASDLGRRRDWRIARGWLEETLGSGSSILDVGCFDGGFLEPLIASYRCYGIEIHNEGRNRATDAGITVIGTDFSTIAGEFDCLTAFDVIEHVEQPRYFLDRCLEAVRTGGWVLISTGNLDAFTFRLMGSRYWYCTIAEHISFTSPKWFSRIATELGYQVEKQITFAHGGTSLPTRVKGIASNLVYLITPSMFSALRRFGMGGKHVRQHPILADHPPGWGSARDHFMVLLRKR